MRDFKSSIFRALTILLLLIAAVLFCVAMVDIAYTTEAKIINGYWILLTGWLGFLFFQLAWYANPLTVLSVLLMKRHPWGALIASALALLCMSQAFSFHEIPIDTHGNTIAIISRGTGFYCWVGMIVCVFYAVIMRLVYRKFNKTQITAEPTAHSMLAVQYAAQNSISTIPLSYPSGAISTKTNP